MSTEAKSGRIGVSNCECSLNRLLALLSHAQRNTIKTSTTANHGSSSAASAFTHQSLYDIRYYTMLVRAVKN